MRVDKEILRAIEGNLAKLQRFRPGFRNALYKRRLNYLTTLAMFHSAALEDPITAKLDLTPNYAGRIHRKRMKAGQEAVQNAYRILQLENDPLTEQSFCRVNGIILNNGDIDGPPTSYRSGRVTLNLRYAPPNALKVPELMRGLVGKLQELREEDRHPVELAIDAHFGIASIQPFPDGNKRTARLVQARVLDKAGYPIPVIPFGERNLYLTLFDEAALQAADTPDRYNPNHTHFADYLASKVNLSLERVLGRDS